MRETSVFGRNHTLSFTQLTELSYTLSLTADDFTLPSVHEARSDISMGSTEVSLIERRAHPRVTVELRCYNAAEKGQGVVARTINISRSGVLLLWDAAAGPEGLPAIGDALKVDVELPSEGRARGRKCIRCRGRVVRVHMTEKRAPMVALAIGQMDFRDHEVSPATLERIDGRREERRKAFREATS